MEIRTNKFLIVAIRYWPEGFEREAGDCDCGGQELACINVLTKFS